MYIKSYRGQGPTWEVKEPCVGGVNFVGWGAGMEVFEGKPKKGYLAVSTSLK